MKRFRSKALAVTAASKFRAAAKHGASKMAGTKAGRKIQGMAESAYSRTPAGKRYAERKMSRLRAEEDAFLVDLMEAQFDAETMTSVEAAMAKALAEVGLDGERARGRGGQVDMTPEAIPGWAGTPLADGEFEVGVCAASEDVEFANALAEVLIEGGFSVTTDHAALHNTRVFVLVYSEFTVAEAPSRLLTDASSRFNNGLTTIIPVVHPRCSPYVLDKIPDSLAYALANTTWFNFQFDLDPMSEVYDDLASTLNNYLRPHEASWWLTGVWRFELVVTGEAGSAVYEVKDVLVYLEQLDATAVRGLTVDGIAFTGRLDGTSLSLTGRYAGRWVQDSEGWQSEFLGFVSHYDLVLRNVGHSLEGTYADYTPEGGLRHGTARGERGGSGITGFYKLALDETDNLPLALYHTGATRLELALPGAYGTVLDGVFDGNKFTVAAELGPHKAITFVGYLKRRDDARLHLKRHHLKGVYYAVEGGLNIVGARKFKAKYLTESRVGLVPSPPLYQAGYEGETGGETPPDASVDSMLHQRLLDAHLGTGTRTSSAAFRQYVFNPLADGEFAAVIAGPDDVIAQHASSLAAALEAAGVGPISTDYKAHGSSARTMVLLLSMATAGDAALVDYVCAAAGAGMPIFNVGVASWWDIFCSSAWEPAAASRFKAALARLNMTDASTLQPDHSSFKALVASIRSHIVPRQHILSGAWMLRPSSMSADAVGAGVAEVPAVATSASASAAAEDLTYFLQVYQQPTSDAVTAVDLRGHRWSGRLSGAELVLTSDGMEIIMSLSECGTVMQGTMQTTSHDAVTGNDNWAASSQGGVTKRDKLLGSAQWIKKRLSKVKSYHYTGTLEADGLSGLFFEKPEAELDEASANMVQRALAFHAETGGCKRAGVEGDAATASRVVSAIAEPRFFGVFQRGGSRLLVKYADSFYNGTVRDGAAKFVVKTKSGEYKTVVGRIVHGRSGTFLRGYSYTSRRGAFKLAYRAKKHLSEENVPVIAAADEAASGVLCPLALVMDVVDGYWAALLAGEYSVFVSLWVPGTDTTLSRTDFAALAASVATAEPPFGEYVDAQYVGRIPIENDSLEAWRYEFECQFTARSLRYCFFLTDGGKIVRAMAQADRTAHTRASQHDVMISYRSTDAGFVDVLQAYLEDHGVSVWRDRRMEAGTDWSSTIAAASRGASSILISALSRNYLASSLCTKEVRLAAELGKPILPIILPATAEPGEGGRRMVAAPYEASGPPATIARALANVTMVDLRGAYSGPDPEDGRALRRAYPTQMSALLRQIRHSLASGITWDVSGKWRLSMTSVGEEAETMAPTLELVQSGSAVTGAASLFNGMVALEVDEAASGALGSRLFFTLLCDDRRWQFTVRAMLAVDGESFDGLFWSPSGNRGVISAARVSRRESVNVGGRSSRNLESLADAVASALESSP
ncbi:uncharacterized protein AMSG_06249 [Thecamonas trahens ATCC 50062]|uniref:TIR domain-containing protein n=1 Tax=Thecamonas trahens ATCC 50062 TaxID=461836 RepID=A0A0L0DCU7_THETB|nr:hypothetical protein AMSG_06249 [Thecamonas trahens ATCC 50062]KNC49941.1 hypothetical protein AMSG_06249 [Thecamonas trahens ATCC 50062]|eukprot:XP_013757418.1 hypothetical protein AMSG_06249 [Thecamonas trahens ATCC 50062]